MKKICNKTIIDKMGNDKKLKNLSLNFIRQTASYGYSYNFSWLGVPIIQFPQDLLGIQEIIWKTKPNLVIETGIAHGGSLIFSASLLELIGTGEVLGIDIDIRKHNRKQIERHKMFKRITMIEGSSVDEKIVKKVYDFARNKKRILLLLDSNHTHEHVLKELLLYSPLVRKGSYIVVFDTAIEDLPKKFFKNRPWDKGNNPKTAVYQFLKENKRFRIDTDIENKLLLTVAPHGYLKCIRD